MIGRKFYRVILATLPCFLIAACVQYRIKDVPYSPPFDHSFIKKIAVVEFSNYTGREDAGTIVPDQIEQLLVSRSGYEVFSRMQLGQLLREHRLSSRGILSPSTVRRIGQLSGVDALVVGNVVKFQLTEDEKKKGLLWFKKRMALVVFTFKVLNTRTGQIVFSKTATGTWWRQAMEGRYYELDEESDYEYMGRALRSAVYRVSEIYPHNQSVRVRVK
jgi:curli biogenesis system outer membrane secretion channel CsgG